MPIKVAETACVTAAIVVVGAGLTCAVGAVAAPVGELVDMGRFRIDRTEVTIGQFRAFAAASGLKTAAEREGGGFEYVAGWQRRAGWTVYAPFGTSGASDLEPAVHVSWEEAGAYCRHVGGRLPTVAEWELAAYTEQRAAPPAPYQTGKTYDFPVIEPTHANTSAADAWPRSAPAGATKAGVNGLYDMGANVWEWVEDAAGNERRTMGGSWWYGPDQMRRGGTASKPPQFYAVYVGFRCVY
jgi:formylglycine-generating enzyme